MKKPTIGYRSILACVAIVLGVAPIAGAHNEYNGKEGTSRCDSWYRPGHDTGTDGKPKDQYKGSHEHESTSDINDLRPVANTEIHQQSGHYVVRNNYGYIEVVGGGTYKGPTPQGKYLPGQGGYVQGEIDPASGFDVEFLAAFFGPKTEAPPSGPEGVVPFVTGSYGKACVDSSGHKVEQQTRTP